MVRPRRDPKVIPAARRSALDCTARLRARPILGPAPCRPRSKCRIDAEDGDAGSQFIAGVARQPAAQGRLFTPFPITVGLVQAVYFINVAFMACAH
jgi:hypothetical protein